MKKPDFRLMVAALASVTLLGAGVASAEVLDSKSSAFKQRDHIYNQMRTKEVICLAKAARLCEKKDGVLTGQECFLATGAAPGGGLISKFGERITKCLSKIDFNKKTPKDSDEAAAYVAMGCPSGPSGGGNYAGVTSWQAGAIDSGKTEIDGLGAVIGAIHCGGPAGSDKDSLKCADKVVNEYIKFANATMNCVRKCEKDVKDKKGNGGLTDDLVCDERDVGADANFLACFDKFGAKAVEKLEQADPGNGANHATVVSLIGDALFNAANSIFNEADDCGGSPSGSFLDARVLY
jgi:hypothetical protein